jgi:hypothetical protein
MLMGGMGTHLHAVVGRVRSKVIERRLGVGLACTESNHLGREHCAHKWSGEVSHKDDGSRDETSAEVSY